MEAEAPMEAEAQGRDRSGKRQRAAGSYGGRETRAVYGDGLIRRETERDEGRNMATGSYGKRR